MDWDSFFMNMAYLVAEKSKDESTHVGAVVVGPDHEVRSVGYNSFPRGINDNVSERQERPEKYFWFAHAERNCIANSSRVGIPLNGCTMYTNGIPCNDCAFAVINAGIKKVVIDKVWDDNNYAQWKEHAERTKIMFSEAEVSLEYWSGDLIDIKRYRKGEVF